MAKDDTTPNIGDILDDFIGIASSNVENAGIWREYPVEFMEFFKSEEYLGESPFPGKQTELVEVINQLLWWKFTGDASKRNDILKNVNEVVCLWGKGAGKDFMASAVLAYVCYLICCLGDPQEFFSKAKGSHLDVINVALNAYQAKNVFFSEFEARLTNCKWFTKSVNRPVKYNEFQKVDTQIRFYNNLVAHSAHSEAGAFEGFNPIMVIYDEIGGFTEEKANFCYRTLRSSSLTRYGDKSLSLFISFPRHEKDFIMKKYKESAEDLSGQVYAMKAASWEVNPTINKEHFKKDYENDPESAKLMYECIPPKYSSGLFQFPERIDEVTVVGKVSQSPVVIENVITNRTLKSGEMKYYVGIKLHGLNLDPAFTYYLGGDCGTKRDSYIITLYHAEPVTTVAIENGEEVVSVVNKPVEDLILEWKPDLEQRLPVDLVNVSEVLEQICRQVYVKKALFDSFNSADLMQRLQTMGIDAEDKQWSNPFQVKLYKNFKALVYTGMIELLDYISPHPSVKLQPNEELKWLKLINDKKVDHDSDKTKDFSDARVAAVWACSTDEAELPSHTADPVIKSAKRGSKYRGHF
jgi:hypothetical protein